MKGFIAVQELHNLGCNTFMFLESNQNFRTQYYQNMLNLFTKVHPEFGNKSIILKMDQEKKTWAISS